MNWNRMIEETNSATNANNKTTVEKIPYAKFAEGIYQIRPLPVGNYEEETPFKTIQQHIIKVGEGGRLLPRFALCWHWLFSTQQQQQFTAKPLTKMQLLSREDYSKYAQHGCPFCRAVQALDAAGFDRKFNGELVAKSANLWNIIVRAKNPQTEADAVYIWSMSNKQHDLLRNSIVGAYAGGKGHDILDIQTGWDWNLVASGVNLQRRYALTPIPIPVPIVGDHKPYNLMEIAAKSFKSYQETVDMLKLAAGNQLAHIGYKIGGDATFANMTDTPLHDTVPAYNAPVAMPQSPYNIPGMSEGHGNTTDYSRTGYENVPSPQLQQQRQQVVQQHTTPQQVLAAPVSNDDFDDFINPTTGKPMF